MTVLAAILGTAMVIAVLLLIQVVLLFLIFDKLEGVSFDTDHLRVALEHHIVNGLHAVKEHADEIRRIMVNR